VGLDLREAGGPYFNMRAYLSQTAILELYLESHYRLLKQVGGMQIMERKTTEPANEP
jgi:hypothetical protein